MKAIHHPILVLAIAAVIILAAPVPSSAVETKDANIWLDEKPTQEHRRFELTDERIERIMNQIRESDPEKAKQLEQLRNEDQEKFKDELRTFMREHFAKNEQYMGARGSHGMPPMPGTEGPGRFGKDFEKGPRGYEMQAEFLDWLKENYPEEAEKLAKLREEKPELYQRQMAISLKKYGRIARASKENPELADVLKQDLVLKKQRDELLRKIKVAPDDEKKKLVEQLQDVVSSRFDLIVKRKQIEYEQLRKKLEKLQEEVKQSQAQVEKWKDSKFKNDNVKAHVEELISGAEKIDWD